MPASLAERLHAARNRLFVGRTDELELFRSALETPSLPFNVLHVFGPGGVGKTSLLRAYERLCFEHDTSAYYLDTRDVEPTPDAFTAALGRVLDLSPGRDPRAVLATQEDRQVLLIDTYETIETLDGWLRGRFLPGLPEHTLVVLAGRNTPAQTWRSDAGWQALVKVVPLRNLEESSCRTLLQQRGVPEDQHEVVMDFTHGHPLATSLVADLMDQQPQQPFQAERAPDVIKALLERFVQKVPGPAHRTALEASALVHYVTEALLQAMLAISDVRDLFEWLRGLSFVEYGPRGLFLHDLARDVLAADLRWRNPEWYAELHQRARRFYTSRLKGTGARSVHMTLSDYTFLLRDHPLVKPLFNQLRSQWDESDAILEDRARDDDTALLVDMVAEHEGDASARIAQHWFDRQPDGVRVYRSGTGAPLGFMFILMLDQATDDERAVDPAAQQAWQYLESQAPLRSGEHATMFRFWMARDAYQDVSPVQSLIFLSQVRHYLNTSGLAFTFLPCRDPGLWGSVFAYAAMERLSEADFDVGSQTYVVFGHDWRTLPPAAWLDLLAERGFEMMPDAKPTSSTRQVIVLNRSSFEDAVRDAFRAFARPHKIRDNPLLRSRLVIDRTGAHADEADRIEVLRQLLAETTETLDADPRDARYYRAVHRTYLQPARTQELAAEQLGIPFSTFRRHLKRGLDRVTEMLWQQEVGLS